MKIAGLYEKIRMDGHSFGGYFAFHKPVFLAADPDIVKDITVKYFQHFEDRGTYYDEDVDPLSAHLFSIRNPKWWVYNTSILS